MSLESNRLARFQKNYLINGNLDFWQRGTGGVTSNYYTDKFRASAAGTMSQTTAKDTDVPFGDGSSIKVTANAQYLTPAAGDVWGFIQGVEANFIQDLIGEEVTATFYVKANHLATYALSMSNAGFNSDYRSYVAPFTIAATNVWQRVDVTTTLPVGVWDTGSNVGMWFLMDLLSGTNGQTATVNQWVASGTQIKRNSTTGDNFFDTIGNTIKFSKIMLYKGKPIPDNMFISAGRNYQEELKLCLRYYEKSYDIGDDPGTTTPTGAYVTDNSKADNARGFNGPVFKEEKAKLPTVTLYNPTSGSAGSGAEYSSATSRTSAPINISTKLPWGWLTMTSAVQPVRHHWTADADY